MEKTPEEIKAEEQAVKEKTLAEKVADEKQKKEQAAIKEACKAYGITNQYLLASRVDGKEVVLVTVGGKKVRYSGAKVERLDRIAITGVNPALAKRKVIAGKSKK